jgi:hypothetical protein
MSQIYNKKNISKWIVILTIIFILILITYVLNNKYKIKENFAFVPWSMGTRFIPSYDLRGYNNIGYNVSYPFIYPWNYPFYLSPYFYEASGKYSNIKLKPYYKSSSSSASLDSDDNDL